MGPYPYGHRHDYWYLHQGTIAVTASTWGDCLLDLFEPGSQSRRIMAVMLERPVNNHEMRDMGVLNYTARISDMRRILRPHGWTIEKERVMGRVYQYSPAPLPVPEKPRGLWEKIKGFMGGMK